jgi:hypothetical protein
MDNETRYYDALRRIAKEYMTTEQIRRTADSEYGLTYLEALEMSYENMKGCAADAIFRKRRPRKHVTVDDGKPRTNTDYGTIA